MSNITLLKGDCIDQMKKMKSGSVDFILSDPPYHLTSITKRFGKEGSAEATTKNNDGSFNRLSKGFMGKTWDGGDIAYNVDMWKEAYNVLKDGGYMAIFGGTRTFHNMANAIQEAGFVIENVVAWTYASGFPKALSLDKAIDKKLGKEREVIGNKELLHFTPGHKGGVFNSSGNEKISVDITAPASDLAKQFEGYKSHIKPAWEPILICKKGEKELDNKLQKKDFVSFIYQAKASKKDRNMDINGEQITGNNHATVKPTILLEKIFSLAEEDKPITVLDMFAGSGSTAVAIERYNAKNNTSHKTVLIEMEEEHCVIIKKRCKCEVQNV